VKRQIFLALTTAAFVLLSGYTAAGETVDLEASADAVVLREQPDSNMGAEAAVWAFSGPAGNEVDSAKSYLRFDASKLAGQVQDARLAVVYTSRRARGAEVYLLQQSAEWDEEMITWNNAPANETESSFLLLDSALRLGTLSGQGAGEEITMVFADDNARQTLIDALNTPPRQITLVLLQRPYAQASIFTIASREAIDLPAPRLKLEVLP